MEFYAKLEGSNEFFARRALYNSKCKLASGNMPEALRFLRVSEKCIRSGGCSIQTEERAAVIRDYYRTKNYAEATA